MKPAWLLPALAAALLAGSAGAETTLPDHQLAGERPEPGFYRFTGSIVLPARAEPLAALVLDYAEQCRQSCRYRVDSVTRTEIVLGESPDHFYTWSFVDDLLDGSYWSEIAVVREPRRIEVRFATADTATLGRLADAKRPHAPFFHDQHGVWTFTELWDEPAGGFRQTRVDVAIEMRSDRWVVNLMPGQILERTKKHLATLFLHLAALPAAGPADPQSPSR